MMNPNGSNNASKPPTTATGMPELTNQRKYAPGAPNVNSLVRSHGKNSHTGHYHEQVLQDHLEARQPCLDELTNPLMHSTATPHNAHLLSDANRLLISENSRFTKTTNPANLSLL